MKSIRAEFSDAVAKGIRGGGPEAVEVVLVGIAKLLVIAGALAVLVAGVTATHVIGLAVALAGIRWLMTERSGSSKAKARASRLRH